MSRRPFQILGVQQIAIGAESFGPVLHLWKELLGLVETGSFESIGENVKEKVLRIEKERPGIEIDIMEPFDPQKRPRVQTPSLNHIGLWVDDLRAAYDFLRQSGVHMAGGIRKGGSGHDIAFIHPKPSETAPLCGCGVLIELVQAPDEMVRQSGE